MRHHLDAAFAVNPKNARALETQRASIEIDQNQWATANKTLDDVLAVDPTDVEALALKATVAWLRDNTADYDALKEEGGSRTDPAYAQLCGIVAHSAVREHLYVEAIQEKLEKEAVKLKR